MSVRTSEEQRIETAVKLLAASHSKPLPQPAVDRWIRKLAPFAGKTALYLALDEACDRTKMPACSEVIDEIMARLSRERGDSRGTWDRNDARPLSPEARAKADNAMVMSTLWLIYEKGWKPSDVTARLGTLLGADPDEVIRSAMERNGAEAVRFWMEHLAPT